MSAPLQCVRVHMHYTVELWTLEIKSFNNTINDIKSLKGAFSPEFPNRIRVERNQRICGFRKTGLTSMAPSNLIKNFYEEF